MGRPKGSKNRVGRELKEIIQGALDRVGGEDYLVARAADKPEAFMSLIAKTIPRREEHSGETTVRVVVVTGIPTKPGNL